MANDLSLVLPIPADLNPGGLTVRMRGTADAPLFCLADVCAVLELVNVPQVAGRLDGDEKGICQTDTPGGRQDMTFVTEAGLYTVLLRSDKPQAKPFHRWVTHEVIPSIRRHGCYPAPEVPQDALLLQLRSMVALRETQLEQAAKQREHEGWLLCVEEQVAEISAVQVAAKEQLERIDPPDGPPPDKTLRAKVNELVRLYCQKTSTDFADVWTSLYKEVYYRCHIDTLARSKNSGRTQLEEIEAAGLMGDLYAIAHEKLRP